MVKVEWLGRYGPQGEADRLPLGREVVKLHHGAAGVVIQVHVCACHTPSPCPQQSVPRDPRMLPPATSPIPVMVTQGRERPPAETGGNRQVIERHPPFAGQGHPT